MSLGDENVPPSNLRAPSTSPEQSGDIDVDRTRRHLLESLTCEADSAHLPSITEKEETIPAQSSTSPTTPNRRKSVRFALPLVETDDTANSFEEPHPITPLQETNPITITPPPSPRQAFTKCLILTRAKVAGACKGKISKIPVPTRRAIPLVKSGRRASRYHILGADSDPFVSDSNSALLVDEQFDQRYLDSPEEAHAHLPLVTVLSGPVTVKKPKSYARYLDGPKLKVLRTTECY